VVPFDRLVMVFLLVFYRSSVAKTHHFFRYFDFKNAVTLKTGLGHLKCHHSIERMRLLVNVLYGSI